MKIELENLKNQPMELQMETRNWRNSPEVVKYFQIGEISLETHKNWLLSLHNEYPSTTAFLIKFDNMPAGVAYFHSTDRNEKVTDWGMYICDVNLRGRGIGKKVLDMCVEYARETMKMRKIKLEVKKDNFAAIKSYEALGFKYVEDKDEKFAKYNLIL